MEYSGCPSLPFSSPSLPMWASEPSSDAQLCEWFIQTWMELWELQRWPLLLALVSECFIPNGRWVSLQTEEVIHIRLYLPLKWNASVDTLPIETVRYCGNTGASVKNIIRIKYQSSPSISCSIFSWGYRAKCLLNRVVWAVFKMHPVENTRSWERSFIMLAKDNSRVMQRKLYPFTENMGDAVMSKSISH